MNDMPEYLTMPPLRDLLRTRYQEQAELPALITEDAASGAWWQLSYGDLGEAVQRTARALARAGARPGGRTGVMLPNGTAFVQVWLALIELNVTMAPVNTGLIGQGLRHVLVSADLDLLVVSAGLLAAVVDACSDAPPAPVVVTVGLEPPPAAAEAGTPLPLSEDIGRATLPSAQEGALRAGAAPFALLSFEHLLAADHPRPPDTTVDPGDPALIIFTSGTTGPSKGVVLSRMAQLWHGMNYLRDFIRLGPGETGYTPLPLFHVSAQGFTLGCLLGGATIAVGSRFSPFSFWETVRRHNAQAFNYVGAMIPLLYHRRPRPDDAANPVRRAVGSATAPELHEPFERRFGLRLIESYGQSEFAGLWLCHPEEGRRIGTVGVPQRWFTAAVLHEDGNPAAAGELGELAVRPADPRLMFTGYWRDPDATARAFPGPGRPDHGWYRTGDAAVCDSDGQFSFRGRLKDFIRRRGENISAFEIEREALTHPAVREAAAVGVPSPLGEDEVKLCVLLHDGMTVAPAALDRHLRARLAAFMRPRYIDIRTVFPRTPTQRVQKFKLREEGVPPGVWARRVRGENT